MIKQKKNKTRMLLILSICANLFFISCLVYAAYLKKDEIIKKIDSLSIFKDSKDFQKKISGLNRTSLLLESDGIIESNYNKRLKILIIGNSLAYHPSLNNNDWDHSSGMAASNINKDYAHLLLNKISCKKKCRINYKIINMAGFERDFTEFDFSRINNLIKFKPDFVIFQLGENVNTESFEEAKLFETRYKELLSFFSKSKIIITTPFFPSYEKNIIIRQVAYDSNAFMVDLSHLAILDKNNLARTQKKYSDEGIGKHPGDKGMENISELIYIALNPLIY